MLQIIFKTINERRILVVSKFSHNLYGCISTYDTLLSKGQILVEFIEEFVKHMKKPYSQNLKFIPRGTRIRPKEYDYCEDAWNVFKKKFLEGKINSFRLKSYKYETTKDGDVNWEEFLSLNIKSNFDFLEMASLIEFYVKRDTLNDTELFNLQAFCVKALKKLDKHLNGVGGLLTIDNMNIGSSTAHESYVGVPYSLSSRNLNKWYRGYFWGNFLSFDHVNLLGGFQLIEQKAPVYKVEKLESGGVYLQLTENIDNFSDRELKQLKQFLKPILPSKQGYTHPLAYQNKRVIEDE